MPGFRRKVKVRKSADTSGISAAVLGRMRAGEARNSNSSGASRMPATTVTWLFGFVCFQPIAADADAASSVEDEGPL